MTFRVTVCGAAETVTGSKYLVETDQMKILVDCGLFQGKKDLRLQNWKEPPFSPRDISAVLLTHAHIDHTGYLPLLVRRGFHGPVYCSAATKELVRLMLLDSAHLQEEEARFANKWGTSKHQPAEPLYTQEDAENALKLLREIPFHTPFELGGKMTVTLTQAGHILGSASLSIDYAGRRVSFSGDIGRYNMPILVDPEPTEYGDVLFCESTYGDTVHQNDGILKDLADIIYEASELGGPIIVPAFAVGRTQVLLYYLAQLERANKIPILPVYVDSPMAVDTTDIYRRHVEEFDTEASALLKAGKKPFLTQRTSFCETREQSKELNWLKGSRIIISASGMVNGGRVMHHLKNWLPEKSTTIVFVGYQAEGTRGRTIQSGADEVKIFGSYIPINAKVKTISGLSAHADKSELVRWLQSGKSEPRLVKVVHGEPETVRAFSNTISSELNWKSSIAQQLEVVEIN